MSRKLTDKQIDVLRWIDATPHRSARWISEDVFELSGDHGAISMSEADARVIGRYVEMVFTGGTLHVLRPAGRRALAASSATQPIAAETNGEVERGR